MKATINRDDLVKVLKRLKPLSARASGDKMMYKDAITMAAMGEELMIAAGPGTGFVAFYLPAQVEEEGSCNVQYNLLDVIKAAPDDELILSSNKRTDIKGMSGFKAHLAQHSTALPFETMNNYALAGTLGDIVLRTGALKDLADISEAFPAYPIGSASLTWVEIAQKNGEATASIQPNELGGIDSFPLEGTISDESKNYVLRTDLLQPILTFAGEYTKLGELKASPGSVMISDPENPQWWGLVAQIVYTRENAR